MDTVILYMQRREWLEHAFLLMGALVCFRCLLFLIKYKSICWQRLIHHLCIQNDHDPSKLFAETPCKLLRYLVENGSHVNAETPYAEVEVMKTCMPLVSLASGNIQFKKSEGQIIQVNILNEMYGLAE